MSVYSLDGLYWPRPSRPPRPCCPSVRMRKMKRKFWVKNKRHPNAMCDYDIFLGQRNYIMRKHIAILSHADSGIQPDNKCDRIDRLTFDEFVRFHASLPQFREIFHVAIPFERNWHEMCVWCRLFSEELCAARLSKVTAFIDFTIWLGKSCEPSNRQPTRVETPHRQWRRNRFEMQAVGLNSNRIFFALSQFNL